MRKWFVVYISNLTTTLPYWVRKKDGILRDAIFLILILTLPKLSILILRIDYLCTDKTEILITGRSNWIDRSCFGLLPGWRTSPMHPVELCRIGRSSSLKTNTCYQKSIPLRQRPGKNLKRFILSLKARTWKSFLPLIPIVLKSTP